MTTRQRLRRSAFLCSHVLANIASYRAGFDGADLVRNEVFWRRANGNFMDIAVLEWCKLFADNRGTYCWRNSLSDPAAFEVALLVHLECTADELATYCKGMRQYRDKFVAHLDEVLTGQYPQFDMAVDSTKFLFRYLWDNEDRGGYFVGLPDDPDRAYRVTLTDARRRYRIAT